MGAMSTSVSLFISPLVIGLCRRKSTRLTAVMGGLITALGCLFTSFASQFHQLFFSYGMMIGKICIYILCFLFTFPFTWFLINTNTNVISSPNKHWLHGFHVVRLNSGSGNRKKISYAHIFYMHSVKKCKEYIFSLE